MEEKKIFEKNGFRYSTIHERTRGRTCSYLIQIEGDAMPDMDTLEEIAMTYGCWEPNIVTHPEDMTVGFAGYVD